jgi:hypothetical protein
MTTAEAAESRLSGASNKAFIPKSESRASITKIFRTNLLGDVEKFDFSKSYSEIHGFPEVP